MVKSLLKSLGFDTKRLTDDSVQAKLANFAREEGGIFEGMLIDDFHWHIYFESENGTILNVYGSDGIDGKGVYTATIDDSEQGVQGKEEKTIEETIKYLFTKYPNS
jgi:hypothetical protein